MTHMKNLIYFQAELSHLLFFQKKALRRKGIDNKIFNCKINELVM